MGVKSRIIDNLKQVSKSKTHLKKYNVKLSLVDDIEEALSRGFGMEEFVEEQLDIAQEAMTKARDIRNFDMNDALAEAEGLIDEFESELNDLGIDDNSLQDFKQQYAELESLIDDLKYRQERIG